MNEEKQIERKTTKIRRKKVSFWPWEDIARFLRYPSSSYWLNERKMKRNCLKIFDPINSETFSLARRTVAGRQRCNEVLTAVNLNISQQFSSGKVHVNCHPINRIANPWNKQNEKENFFTSRTLSGRKLIKENWLIIISGLSISLHSLPHLPYPSSMRKLMMVKTFSEETLFLLVNVFESKALLS